MGFGWGGGKKVDRSDATLSQVEGRAMQILAGRDHSREELHQKLKQRGFGAALIEQALDRIASYGYLDDDRVAGVMARALIRQAWGPRQVQAKMRGKGFNDAQISAALEESAPEEGWEVLARQRLESKFGKPVSELDQADRERAFRHLQYRGFAGDVSRKAIFESPSD